MQTEPRHRPRILLAEDDADFRGVIADRLRRDGCDVLEAKTGDEALDMMVAIAHHEVPENDLELAIMDVRMPGMSGLDIVYLLRSWKWPTSVLLMTAYPDRELFAETHRLGVAVLAKPFGLQLIDRAVAVLL